jgi:L,D-transpeptidase ErfK/SrfK
MDGMSEHERTDPVHGGGPDRDAPRAEPEQPGPRAPAGSKWLRAWLGIGAACLVLGGLAWAGTGYVYRPLISSQDLTAGPLQAASPSQWTREQLATENRRLVSRLQRLEPSGIHVIVDQTQNRLYLKQGEQTLLTAVCSSGSGMVLRQQGTDRSWVFDTPRGRFTVKSKIANPVWRRPDWAFVEESLPIPRDPAERLEYGSLGEYALYLGDGYMIHGTLYERLLGRSVTHGCIRLGRDDLRTVYKLAPIGTPVYIY